MGFRWVLKQAGSADDNLDANEILPAIQAWQAYKHNEPFINAVFEKFDTDRTGKLNKDQLRALLTELDDGNPPSNEEVDWVMACADAQDGDNDNAIDRTELMYAISLWFTHVDQKRSASCLIL